MKKKFEIDNIILLRDNGIALSEDKSFIVKLKSRIDIFLSDEKFFES